MPYFPSFDSSIDPLQEYRTALRKHDWTYGDSDNDWVWLRGRTERAELEDMQQQLDPKFEIWNAIAPSDFQREPSK